MTFTLRSQAFCFFIRITIICHEISRYSVCPHEVVLFEGNCIACEALFFFFFFFFFFATAHTLKDFDNAKKMKIHHKYF